VAGISELVTHFVECRQLGSGLLICPRSKSFYDRFSAHAHAAGRKTWAHMRTKSGDFS